MDLFTAIDTRTSAAKLGEPGPDAAALKRILDAAIRAPDHGRLSPWRFTIIEGAARERLGDAIADMKRRRQPDLSPEDVERDRRKALRAPTIIAVSAAITDVGEKVPPLEQIVAVGAAVQNMFLAAHALGYGAMWKTGPAAYDTGVKQALGIPAEETVVAYLYLGTVVSAGVLQPGSLDGKIRHL